MDLNPNYSLKINRKVSNERNVLVRWLQLQPKHSKMRNKWFSVIIFPSRSLWAILRFAAKCKEENFILSLFVFVCLSSDSAEKFFVLPKEACSDCERLKVFKEVLVSSEALKPKLDRCLKVTSALMKPWLHVHLKWILHSLCYVSVIRICSLTVK